METKVDSLVAKIGELRNERVTIDKAIEALNDLNIYIPSELSSRKHTNSVSLSNAEAELKEIQSNCNHEWQFDSLRSGLVRQQIDYCPKCDATRIHVD